MRKYSHSHVHRSHTVEEYFNFGTTATHRYRLPKIGEGILYDYTHHPGKLIQCLDPHIPAILPDKVYEGYYDVNYPQHKALLQPEHRDSVHCIHCNTYINIFRHAPKVSPSTLEISRRSSTYHPQPLQYCQCTQSAVLVDHRGILRVYGEAQAISLVHFLPCGQQLQHTRLSYYKHAQIPQQLLDGPRPRVELDILPRYMWDSYMIDLSYLNYSEAQIVLPTPLSNFAIRQRPDVAMRKYYQQYAYTHGTAILTVKHLFLPNGMLISTSDPYLKELLDAPMERHSFLNTHKEVTVGTVLRSPRRNYQILELANRLIIDIVAKLQSHYNLPEATHRSHKFQTIGYLQIIRRHDPKHTIANNKHYTSRRFAQDIATMRRIATGILRAMINHKSKETLPSSIYHRPFLVPLPPSVFLRNLKPLKIRPRICYTRSSILL